MSPLLTPHQLGLPPRFRDFYPDQLDTVLALGASNQRFSGLCAPPGCGKSAIAVALSRILDARVLVVVVNKGLQDQYEGEFRSMGLVDIRGQSNYLCQAVQPGGELVEYGRPGDGCDVGPCKAGLQCQLRRGGCDYYDTRTRASRAAIVVTNYDYWMSTNRFSEPGVLGKFDLIVLDEAHNAAGKLSEFCAVELDAREVRQLAGVDFPEDPVGATLVQWARWALDSAPQVAQRRDDLRERLRNDGAGRRASRDLIALDRLLVDLTIIACAHLDTDTTWVLESHLHAAKFTPAWAHKWAETYLYSGCPRILLMSATLSELDLKYLGIPEHARDWREMDSRFPVANRPVYYYPATLAGQPIKVDRHMTDAQAERWTARNDEVIGAYPDSRIIVHSRSYPRARQIAKSSRHGGRIIVHASGGVGDAVAEYLRRPNAVLVSPSLEEGYNFPDDACEVAIIPKVPFLDTRDPVTAMRAAMDKGYGNLITSRAMLQQAGRHVRHERDRGATFVTDGHFGWFRKAAPFPRYFKAAFQQIDSLDQVV